MAIPDEEAIEFALKELALRRGCGSTFCPSEVARLLAPEWRALMPEVRSVARRLQQEGWLHATQQGVLVDALSARGPIRLGLPDN